MRWITLIGLLVIVACASAEQRGGASDSNPYSFTITTPDEWKRINTKRFFMITKDDPFSQYILAQQRPINKPFKHTAQRLDKGMRPLDAANIVVDEIRADGSVFDFKVAELVPALVGGHGGFKMVFTYKTKKKYRFKSIYYGFLQGEWFYTLRYNATEEYFIKENLEVFQRVLQTYQIR